MTHAVGRGRRTGLDRAMGNHYLALSSLVFSCVLLRKWRNWQTRMIQVHVSARMWRFESSLPHRVPCRRDVRLYEDSTYGVLGPLRVPAYCGWNLAATRTFVRFALPYSSHTRVLSSAPRALFQG